MVVDDSDDDILLFHEAFEAIELERGCTVARDGREAIDRIAKMKQEGTLPQLVIMDINMPILDGCSALRILREELGLKDLLVVVFTSSELLEDFQVAYDSGANACVRKPDTYANWVEVIRALIAFFLGDAASKASDEVRGTPLSPTK